MQVNPNQQSQTSPGLQENYITEAMTEEGGGMTTEALHENGGGEHDIFQEFVNQVDRNEDGLISGRELRKGLIGVDSKINRLEKRFLLDAFGNPPIRKLDDDSLKNASELGYITITENGDGNLILQLTDEGKEASQLYRRGRGQPIDTTLPASEAVLNAKVDAFFENEVTTDANGNISIDDFTTYLTENEILNEEQADFFAQNLAYYDGDPSSISNTELRETALPPLEHISFTVNNRGKVSIEATEAGIRFIDNSLEDLEEARAFLDSTGISTVNDLATHLENAHSEDAAYEIEDAENIAYAIEFLVGDGDGNIIAEELVSILGISEDIAYIETNTEGDSTLVIGDTLIEILEPYFPTPVSQEVEEFLESTGISTVNDLANHLMPALSEDDAANIAFLIDAGFGDGDSNITADELSSFIEASYGLAFIEENGSSLIINEALVEHLRP